MNTAFEPSRMPSSAEQEFYCPLLDWIGLTGEQGFIHEEVVGFEQTSIGWHKVTGGEEDNISGDEAFGRLVLLPTVADCACPSATRS
jgi:hypothetical protein